MLAAVFAPGAGAVPAAIDQYVENAPGNLGQPDRPSAGGGDRGGAQEAIGAPGDGVEGSTTASGGTSSDGKGDSVSGGESAETVASVERGGGEVPLAGYPVTPFVLALLLIAAAVLVISAGRVVAARRWSRGLG